MSEEFEAVESFKEGYELYQKSNWEDAFRMIWKLIMILSILSFGVSVWLMAYRLISWLFPVMWAIILSVVASLAAPTPKKK